MNRPEGYYELKRYDGEPIWYSHSYPTVRIWKNPIDLNVAGAYLNLTEEEWDNKDRMLKELIKEP